MPREAIRGASFLLRRSAIIGPVHIRVPWIANFCAFRVSQIIIFKISGMAIEESQVRPRFVAQRKMVQGTTRGTQIGCGKRNEKQQHTKKHPNNKKKNKNRKKHHHKSLEGC